MHLPRSVFSQRQLDLFLWLLKVNNVDDVPSVKSIQGLNATLQKLCGIDSIAYDGALGHKYYVNSLSQIIAQVSSSTRSSQCILTSRVSKEMSNPKVRPHLEFYPEDSGPALSEARQGRRWLHELDSDQTTPMARIADHDYFIYEPAMLRDTSCCIPVRWFMRGKVLFAKCWEMVPVITDTDAYWHVLERDDFEVSQNEFLKNFVQFKADASEYQIPTPCNIKGAWAFVSFVSASNLLSRSLEASI